MTIRVRGGAVRLGNAEFARLVSAPADRAHAEALAVPGVGEGLAAVREPLVEIDLLCSGVRTLLRHHAWASAQAALCLLTVREEERQLMPLPPAHVPSGVARAVRLRPEPVPERAAAPVDEAALDALFVDDPALRGPALAASGAESAWSASSRWADGERTVVVRRCDDGLWLAEAVDDRWWWLPVSATDVWRLLTLLLPGEDELSSRG